MRSSNSWNVKDPLKAGSSAPLEAWETLTVRNRPCATLARMLGGDILCESEQGKGSIFRVTIAPGPLDGVRRLGRFPPGGQGVRVNVRAPLVIVQELRGRVLLAEDVAVNRRLITLILERAGVSVDTAENGRVALEKARAALDAGEPFALDGMDIVVGSDLPPELYSFVAHHGNSGDYFELVFGRDGVEEHRLKARVSKAVLQKMLDWA